MTDYTTLSNTAVGVGGLPSGATVTALRDNPLAIAEGAPDAPKVQGVALGNYYIASVDGLGTTESAIVLPDRVDILKIECSGSTADISRQLEIAYSTDGGSSYGGWLRLFRMSSASSFIATAILNLGEESASYIGFTATGSLTGPNNPTTGANAVKFRMSNSGDAYRVHAYVIGGVA